ncbi:MAG TPA: glycosyl transferase, partial [Clostridiales bacterium]|nr:glycosyl transferase [Clostridiales bacterium]
MEDEKSENLKVSIITPLYNCQGLLDETIKCVIRQTYKDWELLLVDDCSTDFSAKIAKKYEAEDKRIKYIKLNENSGAAIARNTGLQLARGRFIAYLDADDLWKEEKLERQINFMLKNRYELLALDNIQILF